MARRVFRDGLCCTVSGAEAKVVCEPYNRGGDTVSYYFGNRHCAWEFYDNDSILHRNKVTIYIRDGKKWDERYSKVVNE